MHKQGLNKKQFRYKSENFFGNDLHKCDWSHWVTELEPSKKTASDRDMRNPSYVQAFDYNDITILQQLKSRIILELINENE